MYRKFKPTNIFDGRQMLASEQVLILTENGHIEATLPAAEAGEGVELLEGILCPGMINAHCHIELSHMKGVIPEGTGLVEFVRQVIFKRDAPLPVLSAEIYAGAEQHLRNQKLRAMTAAADELYQSGTVAVGDICNSTDSLALKEQSPLYWHNFIEVSGFVDAVADKRLQFSEDMRAAFVKSQSDTTRASSTLTPHAPYSVSKTLFNLLNNQTAGQRISIHNQETAEEDRLYQSVQGGFLELYKALGISLDDFAASRKTSLQTWLPYFNKGQKIIAVHNTFTSEEDVHFAAEMAKAGANEGLPYYCLCVNANLYIEHTLPPVQMLMSNDCKIVLGTDSYASNHQLNLMEEIRTLQKNFPAVPLATMLQWATLNGAQALGIDEVYGSFENDKKPGLVLIDPQTFKSQIINLEA